MKFSYKDWVFIFIPLVIGGIGIFQPIHPWIGYVLITIGLLGIVFVLGFNVWRTHSKKLKQRQKETKDAGLKFPLPDWLIGKDLIRIYKISHEELLQHIKGGLPVYPKDTDIYLGTGNPTPLNEQKIRFLVWNKPPIFETEIENLYFKKEDIENFTTPKFPQVVWLTVKDITQDYSLSIDKLKQHIQNGLVGYIKYIEGSTEKYRPIDKIRDLIALEEWPELADSMIEQWQFKTEDIEKFMKSAT